jgi:predicted outer membrane repeat protein
MLTLLSLLVSSHAVCSHSAPSCTVGVGQTHPDLATAIAAGCTDINVVGNVTENISISGVGDVSITGGTLTSAASGSPIVEMLDSELCLTDIEMTGGTGGTSVPCGGAVRIGPNATFDGRGIWAHDNDATDGGAFCLEGLSVLGSSYIRTNSATGEGGGIYVEAQYRGGLGELVTNLRGNLIQGNDAARGGGVAVRRGHPSGLVRFASDELYYNDASEAGGGIWVDDATVQVFFGLTVEGNAVSAGPGGGMHLQNGAVFGPAEDDYGSWQMTFYGNSAWTSGGGISAIGGSYITLAPFGYLELTDNLARRDDGGGIALVDSTLDNLAGMFPLAGTPGCDLQLYDNEARFGRGGGLFALDSTVTFAPTDAVPGTQLNGNVAAGSGGGMFLRNTTATLYSVFVDDNLSSADGGGIFAGGSSTVSLERMPVQRNSATGDGGGIRVAGSATLTAGNLLLAENTAAAGGGLSASDPNTTTSLYFTTLSQNTAATGAPSHQLFGGGDFFLRDSAVGDSAAGQTACSFGATAQVVYSTADDAACFPNTHFANATVASLDVEPTFNYQPLASSPLVDAASGIANDEDVWGNSRPGGTANDRGAVER